MRSCFTQKFFPALQQDARYFLYLVCPLKCRLSRITADPADLFAVYNPVPFILFMLRSRYTLLVTLHYLGSRKQILAFGQLCQSLPKILFIKNIATSIMILYQWSFDSQFF